MITGRPKWVGFRIDPSDYALFLAVCVESIAEDIPRPYNNAMTYISKLGYGPVLEVTSSYIRDMNRNSYYYFQGDSISLGGSSTVFQIVGSKIRDVYGSYILKYSEGLISRAHGGPYASVSKSEIQTVDQKYTYQISGSLNTFELLATIAVLFGKDAK